MQSDWRKQPKKLPPWASLPDQKRPHLSDPSVCQVKEHRELAEQLERHPQPEKQPHSDVISTGKSVGPGACEIRFASASPGSLKETAMRRALLAVGFAVPVSMPLAPHGGKGGVEGWGPFFSTHGFELGPSGISYSRAGRVMIDMLALASFFIVQFYL